MNVRKIVCMLFFIIVTLCDAYEVDASFHEDFETGASGWLTPDGVWESGSPSAMPATCYNGTGCMGTEMDGTYSSYTDSRLVSPEIVLDDISGDERILLRYMQYISYHHGDAGYLQISVWDADNNEWGQWSDIGDPVSYWERVWSQRVVDLTAYAGQTIRIGFLHTADNRYEDHGWFIDDVRIEVKIPALDGDFESGPGDWSADNGLWQVGTPGHYPAECPSGNQCMGTGIDTKYSYYGRSRLVSPPIDLSEHTGMDSLTLTYDQWYSYGSGDTGYLQVSTLNLTSGTWSSWVSIGGTATGNSDDWQQVAMDMTAYAGQHLKIAFFHVADHRYESHGWFIDNVRMILPPIEPPGAAQPISPAEQTINRTPTYEWINVAGASRYHLVAEDVNSTLVSQWLSSSEANCFTQSGKCSAAPGGRLELGDYSWKVKTANSIGEGPWSETMSFSVTETAYRIHGLDFSPYVDGQNPNLGVHVGQAQLQSRMEIIQPYVRWIRTYGSTHGLEHSGRIAHNLGLKAAVGAWISNDVTNNNAEIENLINTGLAGQADMLIVGSEVLLRGDLTEGQVIAYINQVRQAVPGIPVSYSDVYHVLEAHPAVIDTVDVVLVNYFPYWEGKHVERAISNIHCWHERMLELANGKPVIVGETGWPSAGDTIGLAEPSMDNAGSFFLDFITWARTNAVDYFYFSALDESWKATYEGPQGAHWGVWDKSGAIKPSMMAVFNNESSSNTWNHYCGPGEPAIDFTRVPPYGSYENLKGQAYHIEPDDFKIAVYINVEGWWTKPSFASPTTAIATDGTWTCDITTGGADHTATRIIAFLIPTAWSPPLMSGGEPLPQSLYDNSVAWLETTRSP